jgi:hypothetical protein
MTWFGSLFIGRFFRWMHNSSIVVGMLCSWFQLSSLFSSFNGACSSCRGSIWTVDDYWICCHGISLGVVHCCQVEYSSFMVGELLHPHLGKMLWVPFWIGPLCCTHTLEINQFMVDESYLVEWHLHVNKFFHLLHFLLHIMQFEGKWI